MEPSASILLVDDDDFFRERLSKALIRRGYRVLQANGFNEAIPLVKEHRPPRAVFDLKMPDRNGLSLIEAALAIDPDLSIVVLTGYGSIATATDAIRLGARSYLAKPAEVNEILKAFSDDVIPGSSHDDLPPPTLARIEWEHIQRVLHDCEGNISIAAKRLGLHRRTLQRKLNKGAP
ncbi:MAG: response regulator [bacterium]|nr:response regulator [bacterium]